jgi:hypothetical protein
MMNNILPPPSPTVGSASGPRAALRRPMQYSLWLWLAISLQVFVSIILHFLFGKKNEEIMMNNILPPPSPTVGSASGPRAALRRPMQYSLWLWLAISLQIFVSIILHFLFGKKNEEIMMNSIFPPPSPAVCTASGPRAAQKVVHHYFFIFFAKKKCKIMETNTCNEIASHNQNSRKPPAAPGSLQQCFGKDASRLTN